jgi:uncharacterized protein YjiS (DUF1127 family)
MTHANRTASFGTLFTTLAALTSPAQEFVTSRPSYPALPGLRLRGDLWRHASAALDAARRRRQLARDRRALQQLDDRLLRDIGLSRADVGEELLQSPFLPAKGLWHL